MALNLSQAVTIAGLLRLVDGYSGSGQGLSVSPFGRAAVDTTGGIPTYSGGIVAFAPQATPQDFFTLTGNALVVARLRMVEVWIGATAAAAMELQLVYNTAPDTGGTSTVPVAVALDPLDPAASCALAAYTVAPTAGTTSGPIAVGRAEGPILAGAGTMTPLVWYFSDMNDKPPTLRNVNQQIALNGNGAALPSGIKFSVRFTWTEMLVTTQGA
jgi:hypothetical protein